MTGSTGGGLAATTFFTRTYDEAQALLFATRDYVEDARAFSWSNPTLALLHSAETLRVTTRLTHIMAWLLVQRAVHAGELTSEEARADAMRLDGREVCLEAGAETSAALPERLRGLLERSRRLYQRIARLDQMVAAADRPMDVP